VTLVHVDAERSLGEMRAELAATLGAAVDAATALLRDLLDAVPGLRTALLERLSPALPVAVDERAIDGAVASSIRNLEATRSLVLAGDRLRFRRRRARRSVVSGARRSSRGVRSGALARSSPQPAESMPARAATARGTGSTRSTRDGPRAGVRSDASEAAYGPHVTRRPWRGRQDW
jgi:hypothetical protein